MERSYHICALVGFFTGRNPNIKADEIRILIDNNLIESNFTPLGTEPGDIELLENLISETMMSVIGRGINRDARRKIWNQ